MEDNGADRLINAEEQAVAGSSSSSDEEIESRPRGSGNVQIEPEEDNGDHMGAEGGRREIHRHNPQQTQELENFFKECQHPDEHQRLALSHQLGLTTNQVKFWFQNRRSQWKAHEEEGKENLNLRNEYECLKAENFNLKEAMRNIVYRKSAGPSHLDSQNPSLGEVSRFNLAQEERQENLNLRNQYECLKAENFNLKLAMRNILYRTSVGPSHLHSQNPSLGEVPSFNPLARNMTVPLNPNWSNQNHQWAQPSLNLGIGTSSRRPDTTTSSEDAAATSSSAPPMRTAPSPKNMVFGLLESERSLALELSVHATNQVLRMAREGEPLWRRMCPRGREILDLEEHGRTFHWPVNVPPAPAIHNLRIEASRATAMVFVDVGSLLNVFMDAVKWMNIFPSLVARTATIQRISREPGTELNGRVQLMRAEFMYPSPLLMTRECYFLRACRRAPLGMWVVADYPVDGFHCSRTASNSAHFRRRPSGIVLEELPNGCCSVAWVEHAEAYDEALHPAFNTLLLDGDAFSAQRWLGCLLRTADRISFTLPQALHPDAGIISSVDGRRQVMQLSHRMMTMFHVSISRACRQPWWPIQNPLEDTLRMTAHSYRMRRGHPHGIVVSAVMATWIPFSHNQVFEFLRSEKNRAELEAFSGGSTFEEISHIVTGSDPRNCISLMRIKSPNAQDGTSMDLMIQENYIDPLGSVICFAPIAARVIDTVMTSGDTSYVSLLPCGFLILPAKKSVAGTSSNDSESGESDVSGSTDTECSSITQVVSTSGCILTVAVGVLTSASPVAKISMEMMSAVNNHICNAVRQIQDALTASSASTFSPPPDV